MGGMLPQMRLKKPIGNRTLRSPQLLVILRAARRNRRKNCRLYFCDSHRFVTNAT
jgi:hypothetical protein